MTRTLKALAVVMALGAVPAAMAAGLPQATQAGWVQLAQATGNPSAGEGPGIGDKAAPAPTGPHGRHGPERRMERMISALDLTPEQAKRWRELDAARHTAGKEARESRAQLHRLMQHQLAAPVIDKAALADTHRKLEELHKAESQRRFDDQVQRAELLTPDQRLKAAEMRERHDERKGGPRHGPRHDHDRHDGPGNKAPMDRDHPSTSSYGTPGYSMSGDGFAARIG